MSNYLHATHVAYVCPAASSTICQHGHDCGNGRMRSAAIALRSTYRARVSGGVQEAGERVARLIARLVQNAQIRPGGPVGFVQLHGTDVRLQCVHRLVLLLVENSAGNGGDGRRVSGTYNTKTSALLNMAQFSLRLVIYPLPSAVGQRRRDINMLPGIIMSGRKFTHAHTHTRSLAISHHHQVMQMCIAFN